MKLRNKKTGKIGNLGYSFTNDLCVSWQKDNGFWGTQKYNSLAELNEEWEDYEGPKSGIEGIRLNDMISGRHIVEIDFTKVEEAEKAVEKLKAWQRLKDKGFRFDDWNCGVEEIYFKVPGTFYDRPDMPGEAVSEDTAKDLDLLFGGDD